MRGDRLRPWVLPTAAIAVYATATFLTFGYGANRQCSWEIQSTTYARNGVFEHYGWNEGCSHADAVAAAFALVWPIYWAGRAAIEVTK